MQILLISMGVGMALYLAQEVVDNAYLDLSDCPRGDVVSSNTFSSKASLNEGLVQCSRKKRMLTNGIALEVDAGSRKLVNPISVKIAALRALEALLTVGGSLRSESWRSNVDHLIITVDTDDANGREIQLAALHALLASIVSPTHFRPPYLSQALELFRRGKQQEIGTEVAAFCAHALLALEVVIHRPSPDFPVGKSSRFDERIDGTISDLEDDDDVDEHEQAGTEGYQMLTTTDFENTNEISTAQVAVASNNETATIKGNMIYDHENDKGDSGTDLMEPLPDIDTF